MQKHMIKAFGLSLLAALGLMAFAAAGAQAEDPTPLAGTAGKILISGVELHASATGEQIGAGTLLIPKLNTEIVCQNADVANGLILNPGINLAHAEVLYLECVYWGTKTVKHAGGVELLELTTKLPCEILEDSPSHAAGAILAKGLLKPILHNGVSYVLAEGLTVGVEVTTPSECPLPKLVSVTGTTVFKVIKGDINNDGAQADVELEASKTVSKLFTDVLLFGANESFIDGKALIKLLGVHATLNWGII